jgi:serine/threonine protein kinase
MTTTTHNTLLTGIPVGRYEVVREIGRGGIAVVYLANQPGLDRQVALKELSAVHAHDPAFADRFLREAKIAGSLNHRNIVAVYDYFEIDGVPYIAMEYLANGSLRSHMGDGLDLAQMGVVMDALLDALDHAGRNGVVHRDVKPENLLLGADETIKVGDFGVAKALFAASDTNATVTGMTVGTPAYMAPEQAVGKNVGSPSDLYAAGVVAYELLTGQTPFDDAETPVAMLYRHVHDAPTPPTALRPDLNPLLERWVMDLLAKLPEQRPAARQARERLDEILTAELGPRWHRGVRIAGTPASTGSQTDASAELPVVATTSDRPRRRDTGFLTFVPRLRSRRSPSETAPATDDAVPGAPTPVTADIPAAVPDDVADVAETQPSLRVIARADVPTPAQTPTRRRSRQRVVALVGASTFGVASIAVAGAIIATRGDTPPPAAPQIPDDVPTTRPDVAISGDSAIVADPSGRVLRVALGSLGTTSSAREPATPRAAVVTTAGVLVADDDRVTLRNTTTLAPIWSTATGAGTFVANAPSGPVVAIPDGAANGRLCGVSPGGALTRCVVLGFAPSGLGVVGSRAVVTDAVGGQAVLFTVDPSLITRESSVAVGRQPRGRVVGDPEGRIVVPIARGVAIVDAASATATATIPLPTTPVDLAASPKSADVLAALPGSDAVAVVTPSQPAQPARLIDAGSRPLAVAMAANGQRAVVANDGGSIGSIDLAAETVDRRAPLPRASATPPATLTGATARTSGRTTTITLQLDQPLDPNTVSTIRGTIANGSAVFSLWQGGISARRATLRPGGIAVRFGERPGRLRVQVTPTRGQFQTMSVRRSGDGTRIIVTLTEPPPPPVARPAQTSPQPSTTPRSGGGGGGGGGDPITIIPE